MYKLCEMSVLQLRHNCVPAWQALTKGLTSQVDFGPPLSFWS